MKSLIDSFRDPRFWAIVGPFMVVYGIDYFGLGRIYSDILAGEALHLNFRSGAGLVLDFGGAWENYLSAWPGVPETLLMAGSLALLGFPKTDMFALNAVGVAFNMGLIAFAGVWAARLAKSLDISWPPLFIATLLSAYAPGMATYSATLIPYTTFGILALPMGLGILAIAEGKGEETTATRLTLFVFGFLLAEVFIAGIPLVALGLAIMATYRRNAQSSLLKSFFTPVGGNVYRWGVWIALTILITGIGAFFLRAAFKLIAIRGGAPTNYIYHDILGPDGTRMIALVIALGAVLLFHKLDAIRRFLLGPAGRLVIGWLIGSSIFALDWPFAAFQSLSSRGGGGAAGQTGVIDLQRFFDASDWRYTIPFALIIGVIVVFLSFRSRTRHDRDMAVGVFILGVVGMNSFFVFDLLAYKDSIQTFDTGRYFVPTFAVLSVITVWAWRQTATLRWLTLAAAFAIAGFSAADYYRVAAPLISATRPLEEKLNALNTKFLAQNPDGEIVCDDRTFISQACSLSHAYWVLSLSLPKEAAALARKARVRSAYMPFASTTPVPLSLSEAPTMLITTIPDPYIGGRRVEKLLSWSRPQNRANMATSLYVYKIAEGK